MKTLGIFVAVHGDQRIRDQRIRKSGDRVKIEIENSGVVRSGDLTAQLLSGYWVKQRKLGECLMDCESLKEKVAELGFCHLALLHQGRALTAQLNGG